MINTFPYQAQVYQHKITGELFAAQKFVFRNINKRPDIFYCDAEMTVKLSSKPSVDLEHIFREYDKDYRKYTSYYYCAQISYKQLSPKGQTIAQGIIYKRLNKNDIILTDHTNSIREVLSQKELSKYYCYIGNNNKDFAA